jgi:hypothetical protein
VLYYLAVIIGIYVAFLIAQRADRQARQAFAGRLGALYRARGEFWRLRVWAQEARDRGDAEAAARFLEQAAALVPGITGSSTALRRDHPRYVGEVGWTAGMLDDELAEMGRSLASADLRGCEQWITGRGRPPVEAVLNPGPRLEEDALTARIHMAAGIVVGAAGGFVAWLGIYWGDRDARLSTMFFFIAVGAAVLGHVAHAAKDRLWSGLLAGVRHRWWADSF